MSFFDDYLKGLFGTCAGVISEPLSMPRDGGGEVHFLRVRCASRTYSLEVDTAEEAGRIAVGTMVRIFGTVGRKSSGAYASVKITRIQTESDKDWKAVEAPEFFAGFRFQGVGEVKEKKRTDWQGRSNDNLQLSVMGDTILIQSYSDPNLFDKLPSVGYIQVAGHLDVLLKSNDGGKKSEMIFVIDQFRQVADPAERQKSPPPSAA
ncbi:MAG: hypothetical protein ACRC2T_03670 [Thermoguttaceae bacterium]